METVVDLAESRKAKREKSRQLRQASKKLLTLLEHQRQDIPEEFMTFLLAMAVSDQAMYYAEKAQQWQAGEEFLENLILTIRQLFESNGPMESRAANLKNKPEAAVGRLLPFGGEGIEKPEE